MKNGEEMDSKKGSGGSVDKQAGGGESSSNYDQLQSNTFANNLQQLALASQMGISPAFLDPTMLGAAGMLSTPGGLEMQQLLSMQATARLPGMVDPASAATFSNFTGFAGGYPPGIMPGSNEWMMMAQQANMLAHMGMDVGTNNSIASGLLSEVYGITPNAALQNHQPMSITSKISSASSRHLGKVKSEAYGITASANEQNDSHVSGKRQNHSLSDPSNPGQSAHIGTSYSTKSSSSRKVKSQSSAASSLSAADTSTMNVLARNAKAEQMFQTEWLRQFEQQFLMQQYQLQQQQEQIQAALKLLCKQDNRNNTQTPLHPNDLQQKLQQTIYEQLVSASAGGLQPFLNGTSQDRNRVMESLLSLGNMSTLPSLDGGAASSNSSKSSPRNRTSHGGWQSGRHGGVASSPRIKNRSRDHSSNDHLSSSRGRNRNVDSGARSPERKLSKRGGTSPASSAGSSNPAAAAGTGNIDDIFVPSLFDQLQQSDAAGLKQASTGCRSRPNAATSSSRKMELSGGSQGSEEKFMHPPANDVVSPSSGATQNRRRKQTMPTSLSATSDSPHLPAVKVKPEPGEFLSLGTTNQDVGNPVLAEYKTLKAGGDEVTAPDDVANHAFLAAAKAMLLAQQHGKQGNDGMAAAELKKVMMEACGELISSGQIGNTNAINEMLAAGVAAEMQRLQQEQVSLSRELSMLNKSSTAKLKWSVPATDSNLSSASDEMQSSSSGGSCKGKSPVRTAAHDLHIRDSTSRVKTGDNSDDSGKPRKRRKVAVDEDKLLEPLKKGWSRKVRFKDPNKNHAGEVVYTTPDQVILCNHQEVLKYLEQQSNYALSRSNFSFNPRVPVGTFYTLNKTTNEWEKIYDAKVKTTVNEVTKLEADNNGMDGLPLPSVASTSLKLSKGEHVDIETTAGLADEKARKELERREQLELKAQAKEQQKARAKLLRQQKLEQQRLERELRERQMLEERQRLEMARQLKYQEAIRKAKERETQRQQALLCKQQEREQRRQQLIFMKSLENKRRAEERDRRREQMRTEKILMREKKMEQRRLASKLAQELKMPIEDMYLKNITPLPALCPFQGTLQASDSSTVQLSGQATADLLMVLEFVHTFKDAISIDESSIPTFEQLRCGLLNDPKHIDSLVRLTTALLHQCLCDPGVPAPGPWLHCTTGLKVTDLDVTRGNYSEILRLFIWARIGQTNEITTELESEPFPSLDSEKKAGILAFLTNELVCSQPITSEIDKHLDTLASMRRDKWIVEGKIRQSRIEAANEGDSSSPLKSRSLKSSAISKDTSEEDTEKENGEDETGPSAENRMTSRVSVALRQKMEKLTKEHQSFNDKLFIGTKPLRALDCGLDRYKRRYWVLSHLGGVYVEALESGRCFDDALSDDGEEEEVDHEKVEEEKVTTSSTSSGTFYCTDHTPEAKQHAVSGYDSSCEAHSNQEVTSKSVLTDPCDVTLDLSYRQTQSTSSQCIGSVAACKDAENTAGQQRAVRSADVSACPQLPPVSTAALTQTSPPSLSIVEPALKVSHNTAVTSSDDKQLLTVVAKLGTTASCVSDCANNVATTRGDEITTAGSGIAPVISNEEYATGSSQESVNVSEDPVASKTASQSLSTHHSHSASWNGEKPSSNSQQQDDSTFCVLNLSSCDAKEGRSSSYQNFEVIPGLGKYTAKALSTIGIDPKTLTDEQIQVLTKKSAAPESTAAMDVVTSLSFRARHESDRENKVYAAKSVELREAVQQQSDEVTSPSREDDQLNSENVSTVSSRLSMEIAANQNLPMDLSKPLPVERCSVEAPPSSGFKLTMPYDDASSLAARSDSRGSVATIGDSDIIASKTAELTACDSIAWYSPHAAAPHGVSPFVDVLESAKPIPKETKYGWWKIDNEDELDKFCGALHRRGEREKELLRTMGRFRKHVVDSLQVNSDQPEIGEECVCEEANDTALRIEMDVLKQVEELADRCAAVNITSTMWLANRPKASESCRDFVHVSCLESPVNPNTDSSSDGADHQCADDDESQRDSALTANPMESNARSALGQALCLVRKLEQAIPRHFLKPPLIRKGGATEFSNLPSLSESGAGDVAAGLRTWRHALATATSAAQLVMCVNMLESCIAWEKTAETTLNESSPKHRKKRSNVKRHWAANSTTSPPCKSKKWCHGDDKEPETMLHPIEMKDATTSRKDPHAKPAEDRLAKACIDSKYDSARESSLSCSNLDEYSSGDEIESISFTGTKVARFPLKSNGYAAVDSSTHANDPVTSCSDETCKKKKKSKKRFLDEEEKKRKSLKQILREMLHELQVHDMATYFQFPVNCKEIPDYKKVIKKPIDFHTIENRLRKGRYKTPDLFYADVRMVFDNCQAYNVDESPIGRAGHALRSFFEARWSEVVVLANRAATTPTQSDETS